jgi:predicted phage tail protein
MLVEVKLLGSLGQRFGRKYKLDIDTPAEAFRALAAQLDGFLDYLYEAAKAGVGWQVVDDDPLGMMVDGLDLRVKTNRLILAPRVEIGDGVGRIIGGLSLIAFSFLVPGGFVLSAATFGAIGAKLVLDGLSQLLTPTPDNRKADSETLGQAAARGYQGLAVPILYGKVYINDLIPISATVYSEDIPLGTDGEGGVNWGGGSGETADPYPTMTKMLLHLDNNLTDAKGNTTPVCTAAFYSSVKKVFGSYSLGLAGFDSQGAYIAVAANTSALDIGPASATFEGQFYIDEPYSTNTRSTLVSRWDDFNSLGYYWRYDHFTQEFRFKSDAFTANWAYTLSTASPVFRHLALSVDRLAGTVNCFVDGVPLGAISYPGVLGNQPSNRFLIGALKDDSSINGRLKGYVDEFRVTIGIARYASTFTPPTSAFANS